MVEFSSVNTLSDEPLARSTIPLLQGCRVALSFTEQRGTEAAVSPTFPSLPNSDQPRRRNAIARAIARSRFCWGVWRLSTRGATGTGYGESTSPSNAGEVAAGTNARVAAGPFLSASTVNTPAAIASATHRRPAASKPLRHAGRQNRCRLPPSLRGAKALPHQRQAR